MSTYLVSYTSFTIHNSSIPKRIKNAQVGDNKMPNYNKSNSRIHKKNKQKRTRIEPFIIHLHLRHNLLLINIRASSSLSRGLLGLRPIVCSPIESI
ncbi:hypothetical protein QN277_017045 [Acacia crassicarpa]|uniref:Uncharacterized protein n=1 Tax=Acacia crassicarpa TaxID=499986 RepID=A0AAE1JMR2_9FABA|nr:hypothetical protein QN277_017045 [Acacia crassicarpa]